MIRFPLIALIRPIQIPYHQHHHQTYLLLDIRTHLFKNGNKLQQVHHPPNLVLHHSSLKFPDKTQPVQSLLKIFLCYLNPNLWDRD
ncbi:unnamed protein product [Trichobilharzia regenti]|nr:unnamed protein product [Trichobilharzia regenti]